MSTWLHFAVCLLHHDALVDLLGEDRGREVFESRPYYRWIHQQLLTGWIDEFRDSHNLVLPAAPPRWDDPETTIRIDAGPTVKLLSGHPLERDVAEVLRELHGLHDLGAVLFSDEVGINGTARPTISPIPTMGTRVAGNSGEVLAHYVELQHQWHAVTTKARVPAELRPIVPTGAQLPTELVEAIVVACAATLDTLSELLGSARAAEITATHPLNGEIYAALARRGAS